MSHSKFSGAKLEIVRFWLSMCSMECSRRSAISSKPSSPSSCLITKRQELASIYQTYLSRERNASRSLANLSKAASRRSLHQFTLRRVISSERRNP